MIMELRSEFNTAEIILVDYTYLYTSLPWNKTGSCGITAIAERRLNKLSFEISTPSIIIVPSSNSVSRSNAVIKELFPAPVLPTTPTFEPDITFTSIFLRIRGEFVLYRMPTLINCISPLFGHSKCSSELTLLSLPPCVSCSISYKRLQSKQTLLSHK